MEATASSAPSVIELLVWTYEGRVADAVGDFETRSDVDRLALTSDGCLLCAVDVEGGLSCVHTLRKVVLPVASGGALRGPGLQSGRRAAGRRREERCCTMARAGSKA